MKNEKTNRRKFLQTSMAGGITALTLLKNQKTFAANFYNSDMNLQETTIAELQEKMKSGEVTSRQLVELYLVRIREIDPKIHSVIEINPDAIAIAEKMDKERKKGRVRSRLHGIPVLIKDNIDTKDKMKTTAGSLALLNAPTPKRDAFIVKQLREAGAVILGKTNLSEWANFRSTKSISGWSGRGGQTNNPYILDKNPCGSSSGTGAAISANLAVVGIGTETNGSIICPSVRCGLVGIKPSLGLVSRSGIIPIAASQDTAGPMARTVADAAVLLEILVGTDKNDPVTTQSVKVEKDYTKFLDKNGLSGARLGIARQFLGRNAKQNAEILSHLEILKANGATLVDVTFPTVPNFSEDETSLLLYEFKDGLNKYLAQRKSPYKTLADLIKFNEENKQKEMPLFAQELFEQAQAKNDLSDPVYLQTLQKLKRATQAEGIDAVLVKDNLDAIVSPSVGGAWSLAAIAGYPFITVPAGFVDGLPIGLGFFGRAFSEPVLLKYAYAFEQLTNKREAPKFLPK